MNKTKLTLLTATVILAGVANSQVYADETADNTSEVVTDVPSTGVSVTTPTDNGEAEGAVDTSGSSEVTTPSVVEPEPSTEPSIQPSSESEPSRTTPSSEAKPSSQPSRSSGNGSNSSRANTSSSQSSATVGAVQTQSESSSNSEDKLSDDKESNDSKSESKENDGGEKKDDDKKSSKSKTIATPLQKATLRDLTLAQNKQHSKVTPKSIFGFIGRVLFTLVGLLLLAFGLFAHKKSKSQSFTRL